MADNTAPQDATAVVTESVQKLVLDEKTGEMVSKSELKKREKKRIADAKKVNNFHNSLILQTI